MPRIEAAAHVRAVCRECGAAIEPGQPRFGGEEGPEGARRPRWRHLACAAQAMPDALLRALEFGGWRSVANDDHVELRALIERARTPARVVLREPSESFAGRSNPAMAAAAVLEPAHEAQRLTADQARAWVEADALQARGDVRGELLALELASELTDDPIHARALHRDWHDCWRPFAALLTPSKDLRLRWVGGFLRAAHPKLRRELDVLFAAAPVADLQRLRFEFCTQDELAVLVAAARDHAPQLCALELPEPRLRELGSLGELSSLQSLRIGGRFDPALLDTLSELRALSLTHARELDAGLLARVGGLQTLELAGIELERLDGLAHALPSLQRLSLHGLDLDRGLACLTGAEQLHSLLLPESPLRELGPLPSLASLRELLMTPGNLRLVGELGALTKLERLALRGNNVGELDALEQLESCTHLSLDGTRTTTLAPLRKLKQLRSLALDGGDMRRIDGLDRLRRLEQLVLGKLANCDLALLARLEQLDTLVLAPGGHRPKHLERIGALLRLRRLSAPLSLLTELAEPDRVLARIEVLELSDGGIPDTALLDAMPRLRRVLLPGADPRGVEALADRHAELRLLTELGPRDRLDRCDPFDWRSVHAWGP